MTLDATRILEAALALPADERAELVAILEDSLEREPPEVVGSEWAAEIRRRLDAYRAGESKTYMVEDVEREAEAILAGLEPDIAAAG